MSSSLEIMLNYFFENFIFSNYNYFTFFHLNIIITRILKNILPTDLTLSLAFYIDSIVKMFNI